MRYLKIILLGGLLILLGSTSAFAESYAVNAVMLTNSVNDEINAPLTAGTLEFIKFDGNIIGPASGTLAPSPGEELKTNPNPAAFTNWGLLGKNSLAGGVDVGDGHFKHQVSAGGPVVQNLIVRAWNLAKTKFGESEIFQTMNPSGGQANIDKNLVSFKVTFDVNSPANPLPPPSGLDAGVTPGSGSTPPSVVIKFDTVKGARWFEVETYKDAAYTQKFGNTQTVAKSYHVLYDGTEAQLSTNVIPLDNTFSGSTLYYQVRARNSFGDSTWAQSSKPVPLNEDPFPPRPITDLKATYENGKIILKWTPPYDESNTGAKGVAVTGYDIRVVKGESIINTQYPLGNTAFVGSNWNSAVSIASLPDFTEAVNPVPAAGWGDPPSAPPQQVLEINGTLSGTYFFAIKSTDSLAGTPEDQKRWSYISNVAGVEIPAPPATKVHNLALALGIDLAGLNNVTLSWSKNTSDNVDVYSSGLQNSGYAILYSDEPGTLKTFAAAAGTVYYRIVPHGETPIGVLGGIAPSETVGKVLFALNKAAGGYGTNTLSLPFLIPMGGMNGASIATASDLLKEIRAQQTVDNQNAITMFGYWDKTNQKAVGFYNITFDLNGNPTGEKAHDGTPNTLADISLAKEQPYQISITNPANPAQALTINFELAGKL